MKGDKTGDKGRQKGDKVDTMPNKGQKDQEARQKVLKTHHLIVRASPGCRRPLFKRSVACVTEGVSVVPVVARLRKEDGCSSLRRGLGQAI